MVNRLQFFLLTLFITLVCLNLNFSNALAQTSRPNIIYIMADDLGYADLSCYGRKDYETPHLDKLASEGIKFLNAYSAAPICTPSRVAFMTGLYPARTTVGLYEPLRGSPKEAAVGLKPDSKSVAGMLKQAGYETVLIGKWHLGLKEQFHPVNNGFDQFFGFHPGAIDYISHKVKGKPALYKNSTVIQEEGYITDVFAKHAAEYIGQKHSKPFFLSLQFNAPHWPWMAPGDEPLDSSLVGPAMREGGSPDKYKAMMTSLDNAVGKIMLALDQANLSRNTLVIFTSDNGGEKFSDMGPYAGYKTELKEGGIRVPAFLRWTGTIPANTTTDQLAITMDWTATILAAANASSIANTLDGVNLLPVCIGKQKIFDRTFYWRTFQIGNQKAIREGKWKYLMNDEGEYLFDLIADPGEKNNLKEGNQKMFETLKNKHNVWQRSVLQPIPL
ncbi:sulfatase-like hydrolase/transferase [Chryseolinea sp. H1M3-3]|uniref:sulfatase family protein n=1 Tax=Chryseolinea sp. H1M3-3 TaxID=3034144 RepID=UPI0023EDEAC1|nr:sulfatase-like hydrolase/transferase [Chryseolinea sp. H1M3-3]